MARSTIDVPWEISFPQVCARCTESAEKVKKVTRSKPSAQRWGAWFGLIGAAIASSRQSGSLRYEIPYCENCLRQDRNLLIFTWVAFLLGLLLSCSFPFMTPQVDTSNTFLTAVMLLIALTGAGLIVIVTPALAIIRHNHQALHFKLINERSQSIKLAFRNPAYFERFMHENLERIITFTLKYDRKLPIPLEQAIQMVGARIDELNPTSTQSLSGYFERGQMYLLSERYDLALSDLNRVTNVTGFENPYFLEAQFFRGQAHMKLGHPMLAQADLENYVKAADDRKKVGEAKRWLKELKRS